MLHGHELKFAQALLSEGATSEHTMEKAGKRSRRYGCSDIFGLGEPGRPLAGDFKEYAMNLLRTPQNFYRRAKVQHTIEIDELSGHAVNVSSHTTAKTDDLKKELNW